MKRATMPSCPFCSVPDARILLQNDHAIVLPDAFPVSEGHSLVVPKQHVLSVFDLPVEEQAALWRLVAEIRERLKEQLHPDAFNIGLNDGEAAGQTVMHAHIHVIPRFRGDVEEVRGGVRRVLPKKAAYWKQG